MSSEEMARELERLRADVAALQNAHHDSEDRTSSTLGATPAEPADDLPEGPGVVETHEAELTETLKSQLDELGELLHDEVKNMPAVTSLAVFTLGILLGRFLR